MTSIWHRCYHSFDEIRFLHYEMPKLLVYSGIWRIQRNTGVLAIVTNSRKLWMNGKNLAINCKKTQRI